MTDAIRVLDLFAGAGGLTQGLHEVSDRFTTVRAVESDINAAATFAANHGDSVYAGDIQTWLDEGDVPDADLIVGGPPCQGFSTLGKQDVEDERNHLWREYARTILQARPKYFVVENVASFVKTPQFEQFEGEIASGELREYAFEARILNAADFGAAQVRKRAVLIGHHRDMPFPEFPTPSVEKDAWRTLKDALQGLPESVHHVDLPERSHPFGDAVLRGPYATTELHVTRTYQPISLARFEHIGPGGNRFQLPDELKSTCWRRHTSGSADVMGRLSWDRPSVTIRTEFFKPEKGRYLHPTENRAITHHEAARIQGFPDSYEWVGSKTAIARQIGNAVPIPLARAIGRHLLETL
jgi:DNA (cytosine-5)-methyltransferase 1